ncbi:hypothetical protein H8B09_13000 [Paenibacillus sp. PR3]|uniref:HicB-like antitoxin of toxin-antitoxin system domain-containing protein n=1 Tax=Paenibacillus terricola TaxID=2763503 RepID=A0ABR8MVR2_9BACL|nr:type II toxin-antitoxin system HicB family antitoxin [Paenibacillus terricola]MBD3919675.1 hypothetical protein [Paenibacillus terricola]
MTKDIAYYMIQNYNFIAEYVPPRDDNQSGYYFGVVEELPGCHAISSTMVDLLKDIEEVKIAYFESRIVNGDLIPEPGDMSQRRPTKVRIRIEGSTL